MEYTKKTAIEDIKKRAVSIVADIEFMFQEGKLGFKPLNGMQSLSLNDYGKLCELGYIVYAWEITLREFETALRKVKVNFKVTETCKVYQDTSIGKPEAQHKE